VETDVRAIHGLKMIVLPGDTDRVLGLARLLGSTGSGSMPLEATMNAGGGCASIFRKGRGISFGIWF